MTYNGPWPDSRTPPGANQDDAWKLKRNLLRLGLAGLRAEMVRAEYLRIFERAGRDAANSWAGKLTVAQAQELRL